MSAIYTFWQAYSKHDLLSLTPVIAYNSPQGIFGWSISLAFILTVVSFVLMIIGKSK
ncbi:hypothetical protein IV52_GL000164 [Fructilactobacillus lindneri DSM 20690 = JCM 11027]|uniref:Uncharacterized protein n=2 Tax=Fructilactobacillus lindneri TaxID=53444 RepID=A0A0R2JSJ8_9LACO|nr:hypothetical protein IV52_GL000164 [Fructilactobacillus lindneri DSM 20690 = JCM 11027]